MSPFDTWFFGCLIDCCVYGLVVLRLVFGYCDFVFAVSGVYVC